MNFSVLAGGIEGVFGQQMPLVHSSRIGDATRAWQALQRSVAAPMGPRPGANPAPFGMVLSHGQGSNVWDVDGNRYVDLAAGFGSLLLGHCPPQVQRAVERQAGRLFQAMGDLYPSDVKLKLLQQLANLVPFDEPQIILGQSGADAISSAIKTAMLATGRSELVAFQGAYHGLSFAPLSVCGLRASYRTPFAAALGAVTHFEPYPDDERSPQEILARIDEVLSAKRVAAVLIEPVLGRGGVKPCAPDVMRNLHEICKAHGTLLIADEIWTALGRSGAWFASAPTNEDGERDASELSCDILCLGKGLGGGVPVSACIAPKAVMQAWSRAEEVVDTSTFAGAPLACAAALATLEILRTDRLVERSAVLGSRLRAALTVELLGADVQVRGLGLMLAIDLGPWAGGASRVMAELLDQGFVVSTGGGGREVVVLTPPLTIDEDLLMESVPVIGSAVRRITR